MKVKAWYLVNVNKYTCCIYTVINNSIERKNSARHPLQYNTRWTTMGTVRVRLWQGTDANYASFASPRAPCERGRICIVAQHVDSIEGLQVLSEPAYRFLLFGVCESSTTGRAMCESGANTQRQSGRSRALSSISDFVIEWSWHRVAAPS